MIRDLDAWEGETLPSYDLCIVGSGPAGTTVARELAGSGLRLCLLESGQARTTRHGDRLRAVESVGIQVKEYSRERVVGGASTTWAGLSSPLDEIDLGSRDELGRPAWPLSREELEPYWEAAAERYRFAPTDLYGPEGFGSLKAMGERDLAWESVEEKVFLAASEPQNFGVESQEFFEGGEVDLWTDATVLRLEAAGTDQTVQRAVLISKGGAEWTVKAGAFVLATGGIENARLLLCSTDLCPEGLGNETDQVGRYLMNHPKNYSGIIHLSEPIREWPYYFGCLYQGYAGYAGLRLKDEVLVEQGLLNSYVRFEPLYPWSDSQGVEALVFLVKRSQFFFKGWKARREGKVVSLRDYSETGDDTDLQNERKTLWGWIRLFGLILLHLPSVLRYVASRLRDGSAPPVTTIRLRNFMEMEPDPEHRVTLGKKKDVYGQPLPLVQHETTKRDRRSLMALHDVLRQEVENTGLGRLETDLEGADPWPVNLDASHHMGTTRMGVDPASSVVDRNGRLHSVENVYLAGASVFPSSGCANPTLTLVALSIRLAQHLSKVLPGTSSAGEGGR